MTDKTAIMTDRYRICVEHVEGPSTSHGRFAAEREAEDFAMSNRTRLGLGGCLSWYVEHRDA
jgi:hypothetical protein